MFLGQTKCILESPVSHLNHWCEKIRDRSVRWICPIYMTKDIRSLFCSDRFKLQSVHRWASRFWHTLSLPLLTLLTSGVWVAGALSSCPLLEFQYEDVKESKLFRSHLWVRQKRRSVPSPHENTTWEWLVPMTNVIMFDISYVMANQMCTHLSLCDKNAMQMHMQQSTWTPC